MINQNNFEGDFNRKSGVASFRTIRIKELKTLAKEKGISISQLSSDIIDDYLDFYPFLSQKGIALEFSNAVSTWTSLIPESKLDEAIEISKFETIKTIKTATNDHSFYNIFKFVKKFAKVNDYTLKEFDEIETIKIICNNLMSKNWNYIISNTILNTFRHFNHHGIIDSAEKGLFSIKFSK